MLKPSLKDFDHNLIRMQNEYNFLIVEHSLSLPFFEIGVKTEFSSPVVTVEFFKFAYILSVTL